MTQDLATIGAPIAAALVPGWAVSWAWATQAELDADIPGALAIVNPTPTRSMVSVRVVNPWPSSENLVETLWHELTHAAWSPLTALIPASDGAVMVEEQIVERFGKLLSALSPKLARVVAGAIGTCAAPQLRARISALAPRARGGRQMDPTLIKAALEALIAGDAEKCAEILKGLVVSAAAGGDAPAAPAPEPAGDEAGKMAPAAPADGADKPGEPAPMDGRVVARKGVHVDEETKRARKAAAEDAAELKAMADAARPAAKEALVVGLRARLGAALTPAGEKLIMGAATFAEAQKTAAIIESVAPSADQMRARSGVEIDSKGPALGDKGEDIAKLSAEGFTPKWIAEYTAELQRDPMAARASLEGGRAGLARARMKTNGKAAS